MKCGRLARLWGCQQPYYTDILFRVRALGVRVLGEVTSEACDILREADAIFVTALMEHDLYHKVAQAFAVFVPVRTVGVKGDGRCYDG